MFKVILLGLVASLVPALCQTSGSGIESIRVGMSEEAVDAALKRPDMKKLTTPRDKTMDIWSFSDSGGMNQVTFQNGKVVSIGAHTSVYRGDGRDLVKKLYSLLYAFTKAAPNGERAAMATVVLREYPDVTGGEPIRHIELQFGDRHIDLTVIEPGEDNMVLVGQGVGHEPRTK
jgi:hypothetical protein